MNTPATPQNFPGLSYDALASALGAVVRWRILEKLSVGEPLMTLELARHIGVAATNISKHLAVLRKAGVVVKGRADLYRIAPQWTVPGERAVNLGPVVLRFEKAENEQG